jgi:ABC-2 type transport system ATP-binding protein
LKFLEETMLYAIQTRQLTRDFGALRAVDQISFEVPLGTVFGFLGPNGSGKTTTIRLLLGLIEATSGEAEVLGMNVRRQADDIRAASGALLEHTGLYERLTAEDNLDFYGRVWRMPAVQRKARIQAVLEDIGLWERRRETVGTWSRGMKQKLAVARAMLHQPRLIFLDEPTAGLDPLAAAALRDDLEGLARLQGVTVFLTTHNLPEAEKLCSQVAVVRGGKLLMVGAPDELRMRTGGPRLEVVGRGLTAQVVAGLRALPAVGQVQANETHVEVELKDAEQSAQIVQFLVAQGVQIEEVRKGKASLEEAFLSLMEAEDVH